MDLVPDTGTGFVYVTLLFRGASTGSVSHPLGTLHWTDKGGLLQQAVATHAATEHRALDPSFSFPQNPFTKWLPFKREKGWLPSSAWCK